MMKNDFIVNINDKMEVYRKIWKLFPCVKELVKSGGIPQNPEEEAAVKS